nr:MAG TPA: hypothetical protein [Herelleviridae sp.]
MRSTFPKRTIRTKIDLFGKLSGKQGTYSRKNVSIIGGLF